MLITLSLKVCKEYLDNYEHIPKGKVLQIPNLDSK